MEEQSAAHVSGADPYLGEQAPCQNTRAVRPMGIDLHQCLGVKAGTAKGPLLAHCGISLQCSNISAVREVSGPTADMAGMVEIDPDRASDCGPLPPIPPLGSGTLRPCWRSAIVSLHRVGMQAPACSYGRGLKACAFDP
jgi:hypothetical protein